MTEELSRPGLGHLDVWRLGRVEYEDGLALQKLFGKARAEGLSADSLLLLEHPPVLTLGRAAKRENILADARRLEQLGVGVFDTNRGGDVTYHGPGQLVGYPIIKLLPGRQDVRRYVRDLEEGILRTLSDYGLKAGRIPKWTGVWLGDEANRDARKVAAIGVHLSRWQTSHGFALNVQPNMHHFSLIVACGIQEASVTSMSLELSRKLDMAEVEQKVASHLGEVFDAEIRWREPETQTVAVVPVRLSAKGTEVLLLRRVPSRGGFWQPVTGGIKVGESPGAAAARELGEETGFAAEPAPLNYQHSFAWGESLPPRVMQETAFVARIAESSQPRLSGEHDAFEWLAPELAIERVPFAGLKRAIALAARSVSG